MKTLYPVQSAHLDRLMESLADRGAALDASETGTGKTTVAVEIARQSGGRLLVVGPKAVGPTWRRECRERGVPLVDFFTYEKLRTGRTPWARRDGKRFVWDDPDDVLVVWDECHKAKSYNSLNATLMATCQLPSLMLSATAANSPLEMRALAHRLRLCPWGRFFEWVGDFGVRRNPWHGGLEWAGKKADLERVRGLVFPSCGSRMTRAELAEWFPTNQIITESLDFGDGGQIRRFYAEMETEIAALSEARRGDAWNDLTHTLRARQEAELLKVPVLYDMASDLLDESKSVVVFLNFSASIDAFCAKWKAAGGLCGVVAGGVPAAVRDKAVDDFQADRLRLLVVNSAAGGAGLSLHDLHGRHPRVSLISPDWNEKVFEQALGRIFRAGGRSPVLQKVLVAADTVEEQVVKSMRRKLNNLALLNKLTDSPGEAVD